nr:MAG TPA: hypothetical protein [Caudoviricetes sp.]
MTSSSTRTRPAPYQLLVSAKFATLLQTLQRLKVKLCNLFLILRRKA